MTRNLKDKSKHDILFVNLFEIQLGTPDNESLAKKPNQLDIFFVLINYFFFFLLKSNKLSLIIKLKFEKKFNYS